MKLNGCILDAVGGERLSKFISDDCRGVSAIFILGQAPGAADGTAQRPARIRSQSSEDNFEQVGQRDDCKRTAADISGKQLSPFPPAAARISGSQMRPPMPAGTHLMRHSGAIAALIKLCLLARPKIKIWRHRLFRQVDRGAGFEPDADIDA